MLTHNPPSNGFNMEDPHRVPGVIELKLVSKHAWVLEGPSQLFFMLLE